MKINRIDIKGEVYDIEAYENPVPTGSVIPFAGETSPEGFLLCNGQEVSRVTYVKLFNVIKEKYGAGDGVTTFNVPDYRELTLVGAGQNEKLSITEHDVYNVGEFKDDQFQGHYHKPLESQQGKGTLYTDYGKGSSAELMGGGGFGNLAPSTGESISDGANGIPRTGTTTHSKQIGINYIIKT